MIADVTAAMLDGYRRRETVEKAAPRQLNTAPQTSFLSTSSYWIQ
jgi:hypothetical protein